MYFRQSLGEESPCSTRSIVIVYALNYANMKSMCGPVQKSWQCVTYMTYVIPWISINEHVLEKYKRGTLAKHYERCVEGLIWWRHPPSHVYLVLSFWTMDVDIVSWLCIKGRMIGYRARWPASFVILFLSTRWGQRVAAPQRLNAATEETPCLFVFYSHRWNVSR